VETDLKHLLQAITVMLSSEEILGITDTETQLHSNTVCFAHTCSWSKWRNLH